jgi:hypothetical protein
MDDFFDVNPVAPGRYCFQVPHGVDARVGMILNLKGAAKVCLSLMSGQTVKWDESMSFSGDGLWVTAVDGTSGGDFLMVQADEIESLSFGVKYDDDTQDAN